MLAAALCTWGDTACSAISAVPLNKTCFLGKSLPNVSLSRQRKSQAWVGARGHPVDILFLWAGPAVRSRPGRRIRSKAWCLLLWSCSQLEGTTVERKTAPRQSARRHACGVHLGQESSHPAAIRITEGIFKHPNARGHLRDHGAGSSLSILENFPGDF